MKKILLWLIWAGSAVVYGATLFALIVERYWLPIVFAVSNAFCAIFLFFAEGFEIAFAMLWPSRASAEKNIRETLINLDAEFILAQRQVIVVAAITFMSVTTSALPWLYIPGYRKLAYGAPAIFSMLFVTLTVLWFCQVWPKRIAARFCLRFWEFSKWLVNPIVWAGRTFDLPSPSDDLVAWWERLFRGNAPFDDCNQAVIHVPSLWASCDCAICRPDRDAAESAPQPCQCALCA